MFGAESNAENGAFTHCHLWSIEYFWESLEQALKRASFSHTFRCRPFIEATGNVA